MIVVSGGTGFLGRAVVRELLSRGEKVGVVGRSASRVRGMFGAEVEAREADVRDTVALVPAFAGAEVVVNAVQFPTSPIEIKRKGWTFEEIDLKGTRHQVDAAKTAPSSSLALTACTETPTSVSPLYSSQNAGGIPR